MILLWMCAWALGAEPVATVTLPLAAVEARGVEARVDSPEVRLGQAVWTGAADAETGVLSFETTLVVELTGTGWKEVPLLGRDAVLLGASVGGTAVPVTVRGDHHVWLTDRQGVFTLTVRCLTAPKGERGSVEYELVIPRTPSTRVDLQLPQPDLRPEIADAVRTESTTVGQRTRIRADLLTTDRIHLVGLRDLGNDEERAAKLYAETSHLVSIDEQRVEVFTVVRTSILYAGASTFEVFIPKGLTVVSADGEGAFQYESRATDDGTVLVGQTAYPVRNQYEVSLQLHTELPTEPTTLRLPHARGVERERGWVGVEVPGRVQIEGLTATAMTPLQVQQLPEEVREASVSPILKAWRNEGRGTLDLSATRLPEVEVSSERIDVVRAQTVLGSGGRVMTELSLSMQNRLRHGVQLRLPEGMSVVRAQRDGTPIVPALGPDGVMLPLARTASGVRSTVVVVLESEQEAPGWWGMTPMVLPEVDLPIAQLDWTVTLPKSHTWSSLESETRSQRAVGFGRWLANPPTQRSVGGTPVAAADGVGRSYSRYWLAEGETVRVAVWHQSPAVRAAERLLWAAAWLLGLAGACLLLWRWGLWRRPETA